VAALAALVGCGESAKEQRCATSRDCEAGRWCYLGACEDAAGSDGGRNEAPGARIEIRIAEEEGQVEYGVGERPLATLVGGCVAPRAGELVIHEVLARVPDGEAGDASGDGVRDAYGDEFVEVVNAGSRRVELGGVALLNGERAKHTFEAQCLAPGEAAVVFGGVVGAGPWAAGVTVIRAQARLGLSNSAGAVGLRGADGALLGRFVYSDSGAYSYTLWPELVGVELIPHEQAAPGRLFSPGTCADGSPLADGCPQPAIMDEGDMSD
jgi:hypothetical protein